MYRHARLMMAALLLPSAVLLPASQADQRSLSFNRDIRPLLSQHCFACHGPDEQERAAELRLDERESAVADRGGVRAIVPGRADQSELIRRITTHDPDLRMPPSEHSEGLSADEQTLLRSWIEAGAEYEKHWSFRPVEKKLPDSTIEHPVDAWIQAGLTNSELQPAPQADPRLLARRLAFDLTGLPPSQKLVRRLTEAAEKDGHVPATVISEAVDELFASPHYGERMAVYWLDLVRYADTLGFHGDQDRSVSPYRDYVIQAFQENMPFDRFTVEQLAGDLLPSATLSQKVASTYNRLNRASGEGGGQPKEYLAKYSADRVRTTSAVWLGMTLGCAECHDHKFDPLTAADFYSFAAFFADIKEQGIVSGARHIERLPVPTPEQSAAITQSEARLAELKAEFDRDTPERDAAFAEWLSDLQQFQQQLNPLKAAQLTASGDAVLTQSEDGAILVSGPNPDVSTYELKGVLPSNRPYSTDVALRLEILPHDSLPAKGPGRASNGNFVLNSVELTLRGRPVKWSQAVASHEQNGFTAAKVISGDKDGWAILPQAGKPNSLLLIGRVQEAARTDGEEDTRTNKTEDPAEFTVRLEQQHRTQHTLGHFRISLAEVPGSLNSSLLTTLPPTSLALPENAAADPAWKQRFRDASPLFAELRKQISAVESSLKAQRDAVTTTLATAAGPPRDIRLLPRGNWMDDSGPVMQPAVPRYLLSSMSPEGLTQAAEPSQRLTRLDLAYWITDPSNPLTARTFVNRVWMLFFGSGLARNVDDLGSQGSPPTHPELLDWLAADFVESGWDVQHLIRTIVLSDTYLQSSLISPAVRAVDPENRFYARQARFRLDAEFIRDQALLVSELLNPTVGGRSVRPYQPTGYWAQLNFPKRTYQHDKDDRQYRRGLYTHWQRTFLHPAMLAFDAPAREECTASRSRSNTPLQSLVLLNDPTFVEAARGLSVAVVPQTGALTDQAILDEMFLRVLQRPAGKREADVLLSLLRQRRSEFTSDPESATAFLQTGMFAAKPSADNAEVAAWTSVARVLLNLHETITRY